MALKYTFTLSEQTKRYLDCYMGENDLTRDDKIQEIRKWLQQNPKLKAREDDRTILNFLRCCRFDVERTKEKMAKFYTLKSLRPEWFSNRDPNSPIVQELVKLGPFVALRKPIDNKLVVIVRTGVHNPKIHPIDEVLKVGKMILDVAVSECEMASIFGVTAIFDMSNVTMEHAKQFTPSLIKNCVEMWQNNQSKPKHLEFINAPIYINVVLDIFKSFMSEKLKGRVRVHYSGLDSLHEVVDKKKLPPQYGGFGEDVEDLINYWSNKLMDYREWFKEDEKFKADLQ